MKPFPGPICRANTLGSPYYLNDEQLAWLQRWFPEVENKRLMKKMGISETALHRFARSHGLKKSKEGLHKIRLRQGKKVKKTCEANGYYDSLRGKSPSPQAIEATKRYWEEIRQGKRDHPLEILRKNSPRKYAAYQRKHSEDRKTLIAKERRRGFYGLTRQTKLRLPADPYTRSQVNHRHNALKYGYWFYEDCTEEGGERWNIYYDKDTRRSERFEKNLVADGFRVIAERQYPEKEEEEQDERIQYSTIGILTGTHLR